MTFHTGSRRSQPPLALAVPLSRFTSRVGGGSAFYVRPHSPYHPMNDDFDLTQFFIDLFIGMLIGGLVGALIGRSRGRLVDGLGWGIILGPIGWLIVALGPDVKIAQAAMRMRKCPSCAELVQPDAKVCKHCGRDINPTPTVSPNYFYNKEQAQPKQILSSPDVRFYYSTGGEQQGPVDASDLRLMRQDGPITDDTPVIREGESEWRTFRDYLSLSANRD